jgi:histidinol-phosphatase
VTEADKGAEAAIRARLADSFPHHNVLGEEEGLLAAGGGGEPRPGAPCWVIDPIDGTNNFMASIPVWATLVALRVEDVSVVGACAAPALGETYDAATGLGARCNGDAISVDADTPLEDALVMYAGHPDADASTFNDFFRSLTERAGRTRGFGDFWGHMLVARGAGHVMVEPRLSLWDVAALEPIVSEAGGRLTNLAGAKWSHDEPCLTTNGSLHDEVLALAAG